MKKLLLVFAVCFLYIMTAASLKVIAQPSTDINTYVLFAYDQMSFKGGSELLGWGNIYGNIGVNNAAPTNSYVSLEFGTSGFAYMADGYIAVGDHVRGDADGSFYTLYTNKVTNNFAADIRDPLESPFLPFPPIPAAYNFLPPVIAAGSLPVFPFTPGPGRGTDVAPDKTIAKGASYTFGPGDVLYHNVRINDNAVVTFGDLTYNFWNLSIGKHVTFIVTDATILQIDVKFDPNDFLQFGIGTGAGAKILVGAYGLNWTTTKATNFSHYAEIHASYFSPTGNLDIGGHNELFGHFWARKIGNDANNNIYIPVCPPPCTFNPCVAPYVLEPGHAGTFSTDIHDYSLFAFDQLEWKGGNLSGGFGFIYGNIGVNNPSDTHHFSLIFGSSAGAWMGDGYYAVADFVRADPGSSFYDLFANTFDHNFGADIRDPLSDPPLAAAPLPILTPPLLPFTPNRVITNGPSDIPAGVATDLTIAENAVQNFNSGDGPWRDLIILDNATVNFGAGTFNMRNMDIHKNVTINVDDATILQIDQKFKNNNGLLFGLGTSGGAKILVGSYGLNPTTDQSSNFSHHSEVHANYYAPNGILDIGGQGNNLYGRFWALRITGDKDNNVFCDHPFGSSAPISSVNPGAKGQGIQMSVFPNPANESFFLQIYNPINQGSTLTLQDLAGKEVLHTSLQLQEGVTNYPVSIAGISQGIYIVKLQTGTGVGQTKLIINH